MIPEYYSIAQVADILGSSKETLRRWDKSGKLVPQRNPDNNYREYHRTQLEQFEQAQLLFNSKWGEEVDVTPNRPYK
jgi:DNA (cytosine-5)-methyltransferase 1